MKNLLSEKIRKNFGKAVRKRRLSRNLTQEKAEQSEQAAFVSDISTNFSIVANLALKCTLGQLSPCHLSDVVEDEI